MKVEKTIIREGKLYWALLGLLLFLSLPLQAQIRIGGNVYGGGNKGNVDGSTKVTVKAGDIGAVVDKTGTVDRPLKDPKGKVFGGARMANVGGSSFVHIDGENATDYILINQVFGGNDIAGQVGTAAAVGEEIPTELTEVGTDEKKNKVDNTFNSYVRISSKVATYTQEEIDAASTDPEAAAYGKTTSDVKHYTQAEIDKASTDPEAAAYGKTTSDVMPDPDAKKIYIGQLFGGGNGDFTYTDESGNPLKEGDEYIIKQEDVVIARSTTPFQLPEQNKTYLEIKGGSIVYGYGGGNNATVKEQTVIHFDNPSAVVNHILVNSEGKEADAEAYKTYETNETNEANEANEAYTDLLTTERFKEMGINTTFSQPSSGAFQVGRFFGGNNKAEMSIRPTWNLLAGKIRNLYSGGNKGTMTSPEGLLLEIKDYSTLIVDNLYGGCRMADVRPTVNGEYVPCMNLEGYKFPDELSARVLVRGGHINNVYGGNDVTGTVYGGNAVGIYTTVYGDVYGGGNGAYPYSDAASMQDYEEYSDFNYYNFRYANNYSSSIEALNAFRPNAEQVSLRLWGKDAANPTIIHGSVFVGGNCASLDVKRKDPMVELKMGSYVIADKVFLGNNGEDMLYTDYLTKYSDKDFSTLKLTEKKTFQDYMDGVTMKLKPNIVFDNTANGDPDNYEPYSSYIGSFYCGGNVGSMAIPGKTTINFDKELYIYNKVVGGSNDADVEEGDNNAAYEGGVIGAPDEDGNKIELNFSGLLLQPMRWNEEGTALEWNTKKWNEDGELADAPTDGTYDEDLRFDGGNIYGGCYESGHVNGNVIINLNESTVDKDIFVDAEDEVDDEASGVSLDEQRNDVLASALNVFGGGYGKDTEIWGSTTVNLNKGYSFQIFGGGELGVVGKSKETTGTNETNETNETNGANGANGANETNETNKAYEANEDYSTTVNLRGLVAATSDDNEDPDLAEAEYLYGGGYEGLVCGNTTVNLGNGRLFGAFGGACNANILGHTETYIGRQPKDDGTFQEGFPWTTDYVYGGNDLGGRILGKADFSGTISSDLPIVPYGANGTNGTYGKNITEVSAYVEYVQGNLQSIIGGNYGGYDYHKHTDTVDTDGEFYGYDQPWLESAFVNFIPNKHSQNMVPLVYAGSEGFGKENDEEAGGAATTTPAVRNPHNMFEKDKMQNRSYMLVDIKEGSNFSDTQFFGAGEKAGLGMGVENANADSITAAAVIDLARGEIGEVCGGSVQEGITRRAVINVPAGSTINVKNIFAGAHGDATDANYYPCDVYEGTVNYSSEDATVTGAIFGGNNEARRTLYGKVNVNSPVWSNREKGYLATVYGSGKGVFTWSQYNEVNLNSGARVYEVYGGGMEGCVGNTATVELLSTDGVEGDGTGAILELGNGYTDKGLESTLVTAHNGKKYNTNVLIHKGAVVEGYAYGGGLGNDDNNGSDVLSANAGNVFGTTYIALLGGTVKKDIYGAGTIGSVRNRYRDLKDPDDAGYFVASANVYIEGGTCRNVYGGGWKGSVGNHHGYSIDGDKSDDILGETNVVIGKVDGTSFTDGIPTIQRNAYGGGEGGAVYGTAHITLNNGYVGYEYKDDGASEANGAYRPKIEDDTYYVGNEYQAGNTRLIDAGNIFGGGYSDNGSVDNSEVKMYGGTVRGSVFGGGEIAAVGRGTKGSGAGDANLPGTTHIELYGGKVTRNVFGGGRGFNNLGETGKLGTDGYVFGNTEVHISGGEIGTEEGVAEGYGNVFGGGDVGFVYSGSGKKVGERGGDESLTDGVPSDGGGYYYKDGDIAKGMTEDCKVVVESKEKPITIHNAVFAGGNMPTGSDMLSANTKTVFGNATASIHDVKGSNLVTIGAEHIGGLYGDGNMTLVDGYRELNITNYGTGTTEPRTLNTIQRADFCGIFGSNIMLYGAQDRVPEEVDYTNYAINRVGEVSLNQKSYIGLYSTVNYLGNLTSDVKFTDTRTAADGSTYPADGKTYYDYKVANKASLNRNNGTSQNKVAMSTGVYLEITREPAADATEKDWGYITGVVELDLIDAATGAGGGYVYAKNVHGERHDESEATNVTLSAYNADAASYKQYTYVAAGEANDIESSGNFIHASLPVVDDCFPTAKSYYGDGASPAHFWYIQAGTYVYDEYISAYTGMANTYSSDQLNLPIISNGSNGKLTLIDVKPSLYATETMTIGAVTYQPDDAIDYWTWSQLDKAQQDKFAESPADNLSHANGFLLTSGFSNPEAWQIDAPAPSFMVKEGKDGVYGQQQYDVNSIISKKTYDDYDALTRKPASGQAVFTAAYLITKEYTSTSQHYYPGAPVSEAIDGYTSPAYVSTATIQLSPTEYIYANTLMTAAKKDKYKNDYPSLATAINASVMPAYICTTAGLYGGKYYNTTDKYTALESWCAVSESERANFTYDYDALDLTLDPDYSGNTALYDGTRDPKVYSVAQSIDNNTPVTQTSTLYVPRTANYPDLAKEKIITVVYRYDETADGTEVTNRTERHVINIHINFKSGIPEIGEINKPDVVLPGTTIGMRIPSITTGAFEVTNAGWEIFANETDANNHTNGQPYRNNSDSLYWYQDNYWVAYYAQTYLGKTYSNAVPFTVANYHDLKAVMDDKSHHYYIDHEDAFKERNPKIYINDYSSSNENGLDIFKNLYDLSVLSSSPAEGTPLKGHALLNERVKGGQNLEFFLRTDIDHPESWTTIGTDDICFKGNFHGDGHTISGLDNSLFYNLCGNVYNLGVTGSFNSAGVADKGIGYVESAWVKTSNETPLETKPYAVFGAPSDTTGYQVVNSYFWDGNAGLYQSVAADGAITYDKGAKGVTRAMTAKEFYNGTLAYDLNNFYLYKRYNDHSELDGSPVEYKYWKPGEETPQTGHYANNMDKALCSSGYDSIQYVEERFADGDFRYAAGTIPDEEDERAYIDTEHDNKVKYFPIWPDDYIFFGQKLTYGWAVQAHQNVPTAVVRENGRLSTSNNANRVYRAPAYFRSKEMGVAHFNPHAYLAQKEKDNNAKPAYPNMTAIDFKGHYGANEEAYGTYALGSVSAGSPGGKVFYPPLLDDDGLLSIQNCDETQNLLAYAPAADANAKTYSVLNSYFTEPVYDSYYDNTDGYRLVSEAPTVNVHGHLVQSDLTTTGDHLLVDKQDFNAPIAYTMGSDKRMWYQRIPADKDYVDRTKGWQGISIPFTAELVTTDTKGEITHFYDGSAPSQNGTGTKIGHEYWLREFTDITTDTEEVTATMSYPTAGNGFPVDKTATNTFLWDYYYSKNTQQDANADTYQTYYSTSRTYSNYRYLQGATPYIIGFPGQTYYEFDLSGNFTAKNTLASITGLRKQTITFASNTGIKIAVSDTELAAKAVTYDGYTFKPSYMNETLAAGTNNYALNDEGWTFVKMPDDDDATTVTAFRPYFTVATENHARPLTRSIVFSNIGMGELNPGENLNDTGDVEIYAKGKNIYTVSRTEEDVDIRIVNASGAVMNTYVLEPGKTEVTPISAPGVYIVNKKKVFIE